MNDIDLRATFKGILSAIGSVIIPWLVIMLLPLIFTYLFGGFVMTRKVKFVFASAQSLLAEQTRHGAELFSWKATRSTI